MVSVHSTYGDNHHRGHAHHVKKRKKVIKSDPDLLTRPSWVDANVAHLHIKKVNPKFSINFRQKLGKIRLKMSEKLLKEGSNKAKKIY